MDSLPQEFTSLSATVQGLALMGGRVVVAIQQGE